LLIETRRGVEESAGRGGGDAGRKREERPYQVGLSRRVSLSGKRNKKATKGISPYLRKPGK